MRRKIGDFMRRRPCAGSATVHDIVNGFKSRAVVASLVVAALGGCGRQDPDIVPVRGKVLLDGKPLPLKDVGFVPAAGSASHGGFARTREDGTFELRAVVPGALKIHHGARPGTYAVVLSEPDFSADVEPGRSVPKGSGIRVPAVYQDAAKTPLRAEVGPEENEFLFELSSKAK
jgi:hypothetical protein